MESVKSLFASKTVWGIIITGLSLAGGAWFGLQIDPETQAVLVDEGAAFGAGLGTVVGQALALYGRIVATKKIG